MSQDDFNAEYLDTEPRAVGLARALVRGTLTAAPTPPTCHLLALDDAYENLSSVANVLCANWLHDVPDVPEEERLANVSRIWDLKRAVDLRSVPAIVALTQTLIDEYRQLKGFTR